jgi:serine/threonine protein kinase
MSLTLSKTSKKTIITETYTHSDPRLKGITFTRTSTNGRKSPYVMSCDKGVAPHDSYMVAYPDDMPKELLHSANPQERFNYGMNTFKKIDDIKPENIYFDFTKGYVLFNLDGTPVPHICDFGYCGSIFHDGLLDLEKAIKILKKHPWVVNKKELKIEPIPHYNKGDGKNNFIQVQLLPDEKTWIKLYNKVKNQEFWSVRLKELVHDGYCPDKKHNLLGLLGCVKPLSERE